MLARTIILLIVLALLGLLLGVVFLGWLVLNYWAILVLLVLAGVFRAQIAAGVQWLQSSAD